MRRWIVLAALTVAAVACTSSAGRSRAEAEPAVNPVDSLLAVLAGPDEDPAMRMTELSKNYGEYQLTGEDRARLAEGFAGIAGVDAGLREQLLPALEEELRLCETLADVCRRLGLAEE